MWRMPISPPERITSKFVEDEQIGELYYIENGEAYFDENGILRRELFEEGTDLFF